MFSSFARIVVFLSVGVLAACAAPRQLGQIQSFEAERKLGEEQLAGFLVARGGLYNNARLTAYLNEITDRLAATIDVPEEYRPLRVQILNTNDPSAFALPGGAMFLSRGIIAFATDESQIAGVIAHEITHVVARHSAKRIAANEQRLLDIVREQDQSLRGAPRASQIRIFKQGLEARRGDISLFSQEQELEADRLGLKMVTDAGYDPSRFGELLERMEAYELRRFSRTGINADKLAEINENAGYPQLSERVAALGTFPETEVDTEGQDRFMRVIDGINFDDRYRGGTVRDGVYWHPIQRISFDVPSDVVPAHGSSFRMLSQHGRIDLRVLNSEDVTLDALFDRLKSSDSGTFMPERMTFNGRPAIKGQSKFSDEDGDFISEIAIIDLDGRFAVFGLLTSPKDEAKVRPVFSKILNSVRKIGFGEAPKRRRYRTRRIEEGDTIVSLLDEAAFGMDGEEEFRLLNNLEVGQLPPEGSWIKLVN